MLYTIYFPANIPNYQCKADCQLMVLSKYRHDCHQGLHPKVPIAPAFIGLPLLLEMKFAQHCLAGLLSPPTSHTQEHTMYSVLKQHPRSQTCCSSTHLSPSLPIPAWGCTEEPPRLPTGTWQLFNTKGQCTGIIYDFRVTQR